MTDNHSVMYKTTFRKWSPALEIADFDELFENAGIQCEIRHMQSWRGDAMGGKLWLYVFKSRIDFDLIMMILKSKYS